MSPPNSQLLHALRLAENPHVDLDRLLCNIDLAHLQVTMAAEARRICRLLRQLPHSTAGLAPAVSRLWDVTSLFWHATTDEARDILILEGVPELCRIADTLLETSADKNDQRDLLYVIETLAMCRTYEGTQRVIRAARQPLLPDGHGWWLVFLQYVTKHPYTTHLFRALADPLPPPGFLRFALLDWANEAARKDRKAVHPFNSAEGKQQLEAWLTSSNERDPRFAATAAISLPFISPPERNQLLALALDHASVNVQLEGALATLKCGNQRAVRLLSRWCLEPKVSAKACRYLKNLGLEGAIPREAQDPDFAAMAEFYEMLAPPINVGGEPEDVALYDTRRLYWPPTDDVRQVWLFKYRSPSDGEHGEDEVRVGIVGTAALGLLEPMVPTAGLSPIEVYALYCCVELEVDGDPRAPAEESIEAGLRILQQYNPDLAY